MRLLSYSHAINEALFQSLHDDERVFLIGQGVTSPWYVGDTTRGLIDNFGPKRIIDTPVSENSITGVAVGAALAGMHPILEHPRMDFMYYAMDQIANHAANWHYMFGGQLSVPLTIWGIVNRGGEQGAQHSQALQAMFMHIPGLKVVMPSTPYDAKGLLISSIKDKNPVVYIDDRWLYEYKGDVPKEPYTIPFGEGVIRKAGDDVTLISASNMAHEALDAGIELENYGISVEVIDLRTIKPLDKSIIFESVRKTGRLIIADGGWKTCGLGAEIAALVAESHIFNKLKVPVRRISLQDSPAPASSVLEQGYYKKSNDIVSAVRELICGYSL